MKLKVHTQSAMKKIMEYYGKALENRKKFLEGNYIETVEAFYSMGRFFQFV